MKVRAISRVRNNVERNQFDTSGETNAQITFEFVLLLMFNSLMILHEGQVEFLGVYLKSNGQEM